MACEVYVSAPPASSATVTAGQRVQVKLPGQRTREVTLDTGASTDTPSETKGQAQACPTGAGHPLQAVGQSRGSRRVAIWVAVHRNTAACAEDRVAR